ncbi:MAG: NAD-dependent deacetylase [Verrucomicrobiota bacterium]|jgi:NAD-dependent deacetylase|nr:NAD-dependent deacetylase [Verrucomicrobiota bacterium]
MNTQAIESLAEMISAAQSIVALTGAGMSTASGIPDFRSASGIYADESNVNVFDLDAFRRDPSIYYRFASWFYPIVRDAQPNAAHRALAEWQQRGKEVTVVTQNVDDCHQRAGSSPVYTLHGSLIQSTCLLCGRTVETESLFPAIEKKDVPYCSCGGVFKPNITFFGEMLPEDDWNASIQAMSRADLVLVLGTSLAVYPAAAVPNYRPPGARLAVLNHDPTFLDAEADLVIHADLCAVMEAVCEISD